MLTGLEAHKDFLIELSHPTWIFEQDKDKKLKRDRIKKDWIDFHKKDRRDDHIIFRDIDDELFSEAAKLGGSSVAGGEGNATQKTTDSYLTTNKPGKKGQQIQQLKRETMTDKDWEAKFEMLMREDLIDLP